MVGRPNQKWVVDSTYIGTARVVIASFNIGPVLTKKEYHMQCRKR
jgi:hypothetical protein